MPSKPGTTLGVELGTTGTLLLALLLALVLIGKVRGITRGTMGGTNVAGGMKTCVDGTGVAATAGG